MSRHTPGPWTYEQTHNDDIIWAGNFEVATMVYDRNVVPAVEANARLIAAAPDMLEALELLVGELRYVPDVKEYAKEANAEIDRVDAIARAAIAKARGEP